MDREFRKGDKIIVGDWRLVDRLGCTVIVGREYETSNDYRVVVYGGSPPVKSKVPSFFNRRGRVFVRKCGKEFSEDFIPDVLWFTWRKG